MEEEGEEKANQHWVTKQEQKGDDRNSIEVCKRERRGKFEREKSRKKAE